MYHLKETDWRVDKMNNDRGTVWLGVANVVVNDQEEWLVVKKKYSGLKGLWSLPAGFVKEAETVEMAAKREVLEETGIECEVIGLIGFRSGVIQHKISDNMAIFYSKLTQEDQIAIPQELEIEEVCWMHPTQLVDNALASSMLHEMAKYRVDQFVQPVINGLEPGEQFGYTDYQLFFKKSTQ